MQVLFNYGPNYIATYCNPVGTDYLAQSTTAPGFGVPNSNPPQPVGGSHMAHLTFACIDHYFYDRTVKALSSIQALR